MLVNNAGLWIQGPLEENDPAHIADVIKVNTLGVIYGTKAVIPFMKKKGRGDIIQINSQGGFYAKAERAVYEPSKWAITGFTKGIQKELAPFGIRVTGIYPGKFDSQLFFCETEYKEGDERCFRSKRDSTGDSLCS